MGATLVFIKVPIKVAPISPSLGPVSSNVIIVPIFVCLWYMPLLDATLWVLTPVQR